MEKEQMAAAELLGVEEVIFLKYSDQCLEETPEFRKQIVRLLRLYRPEIVVTSDPYRRYVWHRDHRIAGQVVMDAVFPYARDHLAYPDLLPEGLDPHKVNELWGEWKISTTVRTSPIRLRLNSMRFAATKARSNSFRIRASRTGSSNIFLHFQLVPV